ncbi:MAG TPA: sialidase family protein, partial [Longimicrobium sp.]|nr:sialidase family protein [Longimicrobium sp.]
MMITTRLRKIALALGAAGTAGIVAVACAEARAGGVEWGSTLTLRDRDASNPTAAVDPRSGAAYAAWVETTGGVSSVFVARLEGDGDAAPARVRANDRPGDAAPHEQAPAQVAVGPEGNVYVVWQNSTKIPGRRFPASDLRFARSTDGGRTFEPAVTVNDDAGGTPSSHTFHDLVVGSDGTVWVSWLDSRVRDAERARRNPRPAPASPDAAPKGHGHGGATQGHGGMKGDGGGMKEDADLPGGEIRVARSTDGGRTFGASVVVDGGVCPCCRTSLAVGPDGSLYVAWRKVFDGDVRDVVLSRLAPGASAWSEPARVHADGWVFPGCPHAGPSVAVDERGRVHVGWYTGKEGRQGLWYAASDDGGRSFGAPAALLTGAWVPPSSVALAAEGGRVWAAWDDRREKPGTVQVAVVDGAAPRVIGTMDAARSPALAA